jgi:hypothetical protein
MVLHEELSAPGEQDLAVGEECGSVSAGFSHIPCRAERSRGRIVELRGLRIRVIAAGDETLPLFSRVAVWRLRAAVISPVALNVPDAGSYSSALGCEEPPAIRTLPLGSSVAVCLERAVVIAPVVVKVPLAGSYNSALAHAEDRPGVYE